MKNLSVYIVCPVRSGSTLLDMLLGSVDGFEAIGESFRINSRQGHSDRICTCGAPVERCSYWIAVTKRLKSQGLLNLDQSIHDFMLTEPSGSDDAAAVSARIGVSNPERSLLRDAALVMGSRCLTSALAVFSPSIRLSQNVWSNIHALYDAVRSVRNASVVVDSSKNVGRMKGIYLMRPAETRIIYLIRDGRASCCSMMRAENEPMTVCAQEWMLEHRRIRYALMSVPSQRILKVHYEDLCTNLDTQLNRIVNWLGEERQRTRNFRDESHNVGGNPMRMKKEEVSVVLDDRWRSELNDSDLAVFDSTAGKLNRMLGYS